MYTSWVASANYEVLVVLIRLKQSTTVVVTMLHFVMSNQIGLILPVIMGAHQPCADMYATPRAFACTLQKNGPFFPAWQVVFVQYWVCPCTIYSTAQDVLFIGEYALLPTAYKPSAYTPTLYICWCTYTYSTHPGIYSCMYTYFCRLRQFSEVPSYLAGCSIWRCHKWSSRRFWSST